MSSEMQDLIYAKSYDGVEIFYIVPVSFFRRRHCLPDAPNGFEGELEKAGFLEGGEAAFKYEGADDGGLVLQSMGIRHDSQFQDFINQGGNRL